MFENVIEIFECVGLEFELFVLKVLLSFLCIVVIVVVDVGIIVVVIVDID